MAILKSVSFSKMAFVAGKIIELYWTKRIIFQQTMFDHQRVITIPVISHQIPSFMVKSIVFHDFQCQLSHQMWSNHDRGHQLRNWSHLATAHTFRVTGVGPLEIRPDRSRILCQKRWDDSSVISPEVLTPNAAMSAFRTYNCQLQIAELSY